MTTQVEIYHCPETDEFTVTAPGFDPISTFSEQEARDEADAMADELGCAVAPA